MTNQLLYIVGAPGAGKSSVARDLRTWWDMELVRSALVPHVRLRHPVSGRVVGLELGVPREAFSGTDALAMDIGPRALAFLRTTPVPFVFGEGSRLATRPFLHGAAQAGAVVTLVRLAADEELLTQRWKERGSKQNPSWRKGAGTRAQRLTEWFSDTMPQEKNFRLLLDIDVTEMAVQDAADRIRDVFPLIDLRESAA